MSKQAKEVETTSQVNSEMVCSVTINIHLQ